MSGVPVPDVEDRFAPVSIDRDGPITTVRDTLIAAAMTVVEECPPGRETSLAVTKMEEALFWAERALSDGVG